MASAPVVAVFVNEKCSLPIRSHVILHSYMPKDVNKHRIFANVDTEKECPAVYIDRD